MPVCLYAYVCARRNRVTLVKSSGTTMMNMSFVVEGKCHMRLGYREIIRKRQLEQLLLLLFYMWLLKWWKWRGTSRSIIFKILKILLPLFLKRIIIERCILAIYDENFFSHLILMLLLLLLLLLPQNYFIYNKRNNDFDFVGLPRLAKSMR